MGRKSIRETWLLILWETYRWDIFIIWLEKEVMQKTRKQSLSSVRIKYCNLFEFFLNQFSLVLNWFMS